MSTSQSAVTKVANVTIPASGQDQMIDFYCGKLGFTKRVDVPFGDGYRWVEVAPGDGETTIAIAPPPEGKSAGGRETGISLYTDDIDGYYAELKASGVDVDDEISRFGGPVPPIFWLRDPEKNVLMVVGKLEQ